MMQLYQQPIEDAPVSVLKGKPRQYLEVQPRIMYNDCFFAVGKEMLVGNDEREMIDKIFRRKNN